MEVNILKTIDTSGIQSVLDYGAGTGNLSGYFMQLGAAVDAVDVNQKMLEVGQALRSSALQ